MMKDTEKPYLRTKNLMIGYGTNVLFKNLDLSLPRGQMVCFMGPNGAGKSSLLRTIAGLQKPLAGGIEWQAPGTGQNANRIAIVLTDRLTALNFTVREIVTFGRYPYVGWNLRLSPQDEERIESAIDYIKLRPLLDKKLYELSDGQVQMIMIARALAQDTPVILLDEPTAHLDLNNRVEMMNLLRQLTRTTGKAILLATHDLDLALQTADLIWLTDKNQNILSGLPEDLVLNGSFDRIFEFKGFDLKTGRVHHHPFRKLTVQLTGSGPEYLWTKNALERNGFGITDEEQEISILVQQELSLKWVVKKNNVQREFSSLENVMKLLKQTFA
jgi:iron complex transport system ATP-binding protein